MTKMETSMTKLIANVLVLGSFGLAAACAPESTGTPSTGGTGGVANGSGGAAITGGVSATGAAASGGRATGGQSLTTGGKAAGGGANGGAASCFPPLTDFAAKAGGFGSATRQIVQISTGDSVSLFRPSDANFGQNGCKHPLLVWGNGSTNTVDIWASHLSRVATFGFVVVAPEQTQVTAKQMNDALDYAVQLSQDSSSNYYNKVDTSKLGSTGYSLGGMGAMQVAANARIGATFLWDSFGTSSALHGPLGGIFAENGISTSWASMIDSCPYPSFGMQAAGTTHTSILSFPGTGFGGGTTPYAQEAYVGWFRWQFMGDPAARALFAGPSCGFCTRASITVHTHGID
jgi:hypothetical protein